MDYRLAAPKVPTYSHVVPPLSELLSTEYHI